jgi:N-acetylmuramoyl-L-alanine amidase
MGDYSNKLPNDAALHAVKAMIECGIQLGKITPDYKMYGHRDVGHTECPGNSLYSLINTWNHYDTNVPIKPTPKPYRPN